MGRKIKKTDLERARDMKNKLIKLNLSKAIKEWQKIMSNEAEKRILLAHMHTFKYSEKFKERLRDICLAKGEC